MNTNRISLSSSVFKGRVKKFDAYRHDSRTSQRATSNSDTKQVAELVKKQTKTTLLKKVKPASVKIKKKAQGPVIPGTHKLALQAVGSTQVYQGIVLSDQFNNVPLSGKTVRSKMNTIVYVMAIFVFVFASTVSAQTFISNRQNKQQIEEVLGDESSVTTVDEQGMVEGTGSQPAEKAITTLAISSYQVTNPEEPRYLRIPSLDVYSRIKPLGEKDGAVDAPRNVNDVGWYDGSTRPGNPNGSSLLLGHVSGWTKSGVFKNIGKLKPGALFEVEKGNGEKVRYEVVRSESIPLDKIDMGKILGAEIAGEHDLKLMTCSGKYNRDSETYEERMVVYAKVLR